MDKLIMVHYNAMKNGLFMQRCITEKLLNSVDNLSNRSIPSFERSVTTMSNQVTDSATATTQLTGLRYSLNFPVMERSKEKSLTRQSVTSGYKSKSLRKPGNVQLWCNQLWLSLNSKESLVDYNLGLSRGGTMAINAISPLGEYYN